MNAGMVLVAGMQQVCMVQVLGGPIVGLLVGQFNGWTWGFWHTWHNTWSSRHDAIVWRWMKMFDEEA